MSTDRAKGTRVPSVLGFRPTKEFWRRMMQWKELYARRNGGRASSVSNQFALPYLMSLAMTAEGVPDSGEVRR